jgi:hypothetical protein
MPREDIQERLADLGTKVAKLRDKDPAPSWKDISTTLEIGQGKVMLAYLFHTTDPKDRIKGRNEDELAKNVVKARDGGLSWAIISARAGIPESTARGLYEKTTGSSTKGNRIGKGGRYPGDSNGAGPVKKAVAKKAVAKKAAPVKKAVAKKQPAAKSAPVKKAVAKKVVAKKAVAKKSATPASAATGGGSGKLVDMDLSGLKGKLEGRGISYESPNGGKLQSLRVKTVVSLSEDGVVSFLDERTGNERSVRVSSIKRLTSA